MADEERFSRIELEGAGGPGDTNFLMATINSLRAEVEAQKKIAAHWFENLQEEININKKLIAEIERLKKELKGYESNATWNDTCEKLAKLREAALEVIDDIEVLYSWKAFKGDKDKRISDLKQILFVALGEEVKQ